MLRAAGGVLVAVAVAGAQENAPGPLPVPEAQPKPAVMARVDEGRLAEHVLAPGDTVSYEVEEDTGTSYAGAKVVRVGSDGMLELPILGPTKVWGKTIRQARADIKAALERDYYQVATVRMSLNLRGGSIYLQGEVNSQGRQDIPPDETFTLSKAIARAGGIGKFGNTKRVQVRRKKPDGTFETITVNFDEISRKGASEKDVELRHEDIIFVPDKLFNF